MLIKHALILAAGRGIRLMPLTKNIPKALVKIDNQTLILKGIKKIRKTFKNIHITVGYKGNLTASHVIKHKVSSVINTNNKGNAWWIFNFPFSNLNEPIIVLTCDNITNINFHLLEKDYLKQKSPACFLVPVKPINNLEGDYIHSKNNFVKILSRTKKADLYCSGIQIINPFRINKLIKQSENFYNVWKSLIRLNQLKVSNIIPKKWFTIDNIKQLKYYKNN